MLPPQAPEAVKVNGRATAGPPAGTMPYVCGPFGDVTPLVARRVTTRLVVSALPTFVRAKFRVTVSPRSMAPLVEKQFSNTSLVEPNTTTGVGANGTIEKFVSEMSKKILPAASTLMRAAEVAR